jgi:hypothetical protein
MGLDEIAEIFTHWHKIPFAVALFDAMEAHPNFEVGRASKNVVKFLSQINDADPNSTEYSEDDLGAFWGHAQFTAGGLTCKSVLTSWHEVGSVEMACKLIAAAIKTCKVARITCTNTIHRGHALAGPYYLSDTYLANMIERLWYLWEKEQVSYFPHDLTNWVLYLQLHCHIFPVDSPSCSHHRNPSFPVKPT